MFLRYGLRELGGVDSRKRNFKEIRKGRKETELLSGPSDAGNNFFAPPQR